MALWQGKSRRKPSGGRLRPARKKRKFEIGREQQYAFTGEQRVKLYKTRGHGQKVRLLRVEWANVLDPKKNVTRRSRILTVKGNPANPHFVQRNIITKGATIETELGTASVTSRPGQDGVVNAVLVE
ncbi:MAG: 30S ribosomal protein S8e [Thermoplasmata archaeon]